MKTNETKFTPGPWTVSGMAVHAHNGREIIFGAHNTRSGDADERSANANLIAAVPDLYNAIERLLHPMADDSDIDFARDALAKARGEA